VSIRNAKLASTIQRALQQILQQGLQDPRAESAMITVTALELSPDAKHAAIKVSVLPAQAEKRVIAALKHAAPFIRRETSDKVAMASLPTFNFELDRSLKNQAAVFEALREAGVGPSESEKAADDATLDEPKPPPAS
jgi:ribosome-binding factor A